MPAPNPDFRPPDRTLDGGDWPNRRSDAATILARLETERHVHVQAPPGYGKDALVFELSEALGDRGTVAWLAHDTIGDPDPLSRLARAIDPELGDSARDGDAHNTWSAIIDHFAASEGDDEVLIVAGADHLIPPEPDSFVIPPAFSNQVRLVTISIASLSAILPDLVPTVANDRTLRLLAFPAPSESFDLSDEERLAQSEADYISDGEAWFESYLARLEGQDEKPELEHIFKVKYASRAGELWRGHPLVNMAALSSMLDAVRNGVRAAAALNEFRDHLSRLRTGALFERLLPFRPGAVGAASAVACRSIAAALEAWIESDMRDAALAPAQRDWLIASGLCRDAGASGAIEWSDALSLIGGRNGALDWARALRGTSAAVIVEQSDQARFRCQGFRIAKSLLMDKLESDLRSDEFRLQIDEGRIVDRDRLYRFHLKEFGPDARKNPGHGPNREFDVFVFEDREGADFYWRHQIRILSMLGRMRHPALLPFLRGGELTDLPGMATSSKFHYIEVDRRTSASSGDQAHFLVERINPRRSVEQAAVEPNPVFAQLVRLAEAIDLIHAQGIIHRSIDFRAIELHETGNAQQLVLTGFEFAANVRSEVIASNGRFSPHEGRTSWDFACRAPNWRPLHANVVDPSLDVYAFGALSAMIVTGLPDTPLDAEVLDCLAGRSIEASDQDSLQADETIKRALDALHAELHCDKRWAGLDPRAQEMADVLRKCLDREPARRPPMEDVARLLRARHEEYLAQFVRAGETLHVSYSEKTMGKMLKQLNLVDEDQDIASGEGVQWLRRRIEEWVDSAKWMHFRAGGFHRKGELDHDRFEHTRRESQFLIAGPSVIFFASVYRSRANTNEDPRLLFLTYAVRRNEMLLPDPDNADQISLRATTEEVSWVPKPGLVRTIREEDITGLPAESASWEPTLELLRQRGRSTSERRLGRQAALAWRTHRDIVLAHDQIRNFPVHVERIGSCRYALSLDLAIFRQWNERGSNGFLRKAILSGRSERAFFLDTIQQQAERAGENQLEFMLIRSGRTRAAGVQRVIGTLSLPIREGRVEFTVDPSDEQAGIPTKGRMGWFDSIGTEVAAERQSSAIERLERRTWMMNSLVNPGSRGNYRWPEPVHTASLLGSAPKENIEKFNERLQDMLSSDPLHAVQGPPGTGKTTLIAALVAEILAANDGSRILVTSQSHAATDNVLIAVMRALEEIDGDCGGPLGEGRPLVALRLFSETTREQVDPVVQRRYSINAQVREARNRMRAEADAVIASSGKSDQASRYLRHAADHGYLEVRLKLERSAPLIFATTGAAMSSLDYLRRGTIGYDFVLIDEAAKAWAIDLVQPLAMADRAILVGDQNQLPPFGDIELDTFLARAKLLAEQIDAPFDLAELLDTSRVEDRNESSFEQMNDWLKLFHRTFEKAADSSDTKGERKRVVQSLDKQFRSVPAIGRLVSETFYPEIGIRNAGPDPDEEKRMPIPLRSGNRELRPALVWIDTSALTASEYFTKGSANEGLINRGEAELLRQLLPGLDLDCRNPAERLRVLSPYKKQIGLIRHLCQERSPGIGSESFEQLFQTADSAQGSEADVVIVSLCRRTVNSSSTRIAAGASKEAQLAELKRQINAKLGFLQLPQRLNVILSRARQQLILIGDFAFYQEGGRLLDAYAALNHGGDAPPNFWQRLLDRFEPLDESNLPVGERLEDPIVLGAEQLRLAL